MGLMVHALPISAAGANFDYNCHCFVMTVTVQACKVVVSNCDSAAAGEGSSGTNGKGLFSDQIGRLGSNCIGGLFDRLFGRLLEGCSNASSGDCSLGL